MYEQHFGFSRRLFTDGLAQGDAVFTTEATKQLVRDLEISLTRKDSVVIISGQSGTGKSAITSDALKIINTRLAFCCVSHAPMTSHELLEQLLTDFGFEPYKLSRVERLQIWRQFLSEMAATATPVCLLVEDAENLSPEVLHSLHNLTAADAANSPGANVILTTAQPPERLLTTEDMLGFNQRVRLRRRIEPLTENETREYLRFKCRRAGADADDVFANELAPLLYQLSGGIFRVMENLLESALISAAAANEPTVTAERLSNIAEQQFGITRLDAADVEDLLTESTGSESLSPSGLRAIPTLTELVGLREQDETADPDAETEESTRRRQRTVSTQR